MVDLFSQAVQPVGFNDAVPVQKQFLEPFVLLQVQAENAPEPQQGRNKRSPQSG
jgi:hypothetical protein